MNRHPIRSMFVFAAVIATLVLGGAPVAAQTTPFSFTYTSIGEVDTSCDFLVLRDDVGKAMGRISDKGVDITNAGVATITNPDTGLFVTQKYQVLFKNRNMVVNADGSWSFDSTTVGSSTLYDANGQVLLRSHGPMTVHLVFDAAGNLVSQEITFEHGSHDGYCETLAAALGA